MANLIRGVPLRSVQPRDMTWRDGAIHEAGHVVCAMAAGGCPVFVALNRNPPVNGLAFVDVVCSDDANVAIDFAVAGGVAQGVRWLGHADARIATTWAMINDKDLQEELPKARERVGALLGRHWRAVEALADVLLERRLVHRPVIERVVTWACPELRGRVQAGANSLEKMWRLALIVARVGLKSLPYVPRQTNYACID